MASGDDPNNQKKPLRNNDLEGLGMAELLNLYEKSNIAEGEIVRGRVLKLTPSDVVVDVGAKSEGLLPVGEVTGFDGKVKVKPGDDIEVFVERLEDPSGYVVLSRRAILEVEQAAQKKETFGRLQEGQITHGIVKNITDYGVFVDLGGVDGLLHITDISWGRVTHPSEYFNVGDEIEVQVLKFDPAAERVSLGYKQKGQDPWTGVVDRYPLGTKVHGRVVSLTDYGAFVELEEGIEGLIHVSEMSWTKKVRPSKLLNMGDEVEAVVTDVNVPNRRISLSLKALEQNPWDTIAQRYPVGTVINGRVRNLSDFGALVEVEEGIDGLIHISDMSWNRRLKHPNEVLKKGDTVQARVINVDGENQRLSLSIKEFLPNEWDNFAKAHNVGDEVVGAVAKITDFGLFIKVADGVEGLAHVSEISRDSKQKLDKVFHIGEPVRARIIKIDWNDKKIGLSTRDVQPLTDEERAQAGDHSDHGDQGGGDEHSEPEPVPHE